MLSENECLHCLNTTRRLSTPTLSKFRKKRWSFLAFFTLIFLMMFATRYVYYIKASSHEEWDAVTTTWIPPNKTIPIYVLCYAQTEDDNLTAAEDLDPPENSIFFHETSCFGTLTSRQACAVESAARAHPHRIVYVLFNSRVTKSALQVGSLATLLLLPNVRLARVHIDKYANNTPLAEVLLGAQTMDRSWMVEHMSDLLRFITLYKFGGIYFDTDMIIVKSVDELGADWVAREDDATISVGAIALSYQGIGRQVAETVVNDLEWNFRPLHWSHNGPGAINRGVLSICTVGLDISTTNTGDFSCQGFIVYHPSYFYPVHYNKSASIFKAGSLQPSPDAYGYHMWNKITKDKKIEPGSLYELLASKYCPSIRRLYGDKFGF